MFQGMEYVYEIYKEKSFSKAAKKLYISQPSLSATVKRIENKVGYPLFDRGKKPLELTECGMQYIRTVEQIMAAKAEFSNFVNDFGDLKLGRLSIGGGSLFLSCVLPSVIREFCKQYPSIQVELIEESTGKLEEYLQSGAVDFILDNSKMDEESFERIALKEEHLILVVPKSFAVNEKLKEYQISPEIIADGSYLKEEIKDVPIKAFESEPFILLKQENDTRERAIHLFKDSKFKPNVVFELDQQMTAFNVACSGVGISFISDTLIARMPYNPNVVYYKLKGKNTARQIYFYWKKGRYVSHAMNEFLKIVKKKYE